MVGQRKKGDDNAPGRKRPPVSTNRPTNSKNDDVVVRITWNVFTSILSELGHLKDPYIDRGTTAKIWQGYKKREHPVSQPRNQHMVDVDVVFNDYCYGLQDHMDDQKELEGRGAHKRGKPIMGISAGDTTTNGATNPNKSVTSPEQWKQDIMSYSCDSDSGNSGSESHHDNIDHASTVEGGSAAAHDLVNMALNTTSKPGSSIPITDGISDLHDTSHTTSHNVATDTENDPRTSSNINKGNPINFQLNSDSVPSDAFSDTNKIEESYEALDSHQ